MAVDDRVDFFVSHAGPDAAWAAWVDQTLRTAGFSTITDLYDFQPGRNFILLMDDALRRADRVLLIWSPQAEQRYMVETEWTSALAVRAERVVPVIVQPCPKPAVLAATLHIDLTSCADGASAARTLLEGLQPRARPAVSVAFPGPTGPTGVPVDEVPVAYPPSWAASRVGTRLLTPDKIVISRGSVQETLVVSGTIKLGGQRVDARTSRHGRRWTSEFVAAVAGDDTAFRVTYHEQPLTGYVRVSELVVDGTAVPIVDRR